MFGKNSVKNRTDLAENLKKSGSEEPIEPCFLQLCTDVVKNIFYEREKNIGYKAIKVSKIHSP